MAERGTVTLLFKKMDWNEFKLTYKKDVRVIFFWDKIKNPKTGITFADQSTDIFLPKYTNGDWTDGEPISVVMGKGGALVRIPAIKVREGYFVLDGVHRLLELKPRYIVIDWIELSEKDKRYSVDVTYRNL